MTHEPLSWEEQLRQRTEEARRDPRSSHELIAAALSEQDENRVSDLVWVLHYRATRDVVEAAAELCESDCAEERSLAAWVLGQVGIPDRTFPEECHQLLAGMLKRETDPEVLRDLGIACGHLNHPGAVPFLVRLASHPDDRVRYGVVFGLTGEDDPQAVAALIALTADADEVVRDWATFALGTQTDLDTPELREALARRLEDSSPVVRAETVAGLANRRDPRALPLLVAAIDASHEEDGPIDLCLRNLLEAAEAMADTRLLPALLRCRDRGCEEPESLENAIGACGGVA